jgi:hypothetical protein
MARRAGRGGATVKRRPKAPRGKRQFIAMPFLPLIQFLPRDPPSLARIRHPSMLEPGRQRRDMAPWFNEKSIGYGVGPRSWQGWLLMLAMILVVIAACVTAIQLPDLARWMPLIVVALTAAGTIILLSVKSGGNGV